ncbi:RNA-binding domain-containing protein [Terfezia boudieri ATCC MYA-4762]|uniref:RNA-binding domain-containing protein n=1 Tax=Terfezia boudieri ATCC MYA-4762 TaxID=1051890 RepID=A0A3N4LXM3_9PEZI|nr:RNA-binding domain-containing protein [Terfezia boudieri ATCC MYA-4762]
MGKSTAPKKAAVKEVVSRKVAQAVKKVDDKKASSKKDEKKKTKKKEPTPEPESESESESEPKSESESGDSSDSDEFSSERDSSSDEEESDTEMKDASDSDSGSDSEDGSEDEKKPAAKANGVKVENKKMAVRSDDSDSNDSSDSEPKTEKNAVEKAKASDSESGASDGSDSESDSDSVSVSDSDSDSESESEEEKKEEKKEEKPTEKKRKAEAAPVFEAKKSKTEASAENQTGSCTLFCGSLSFNVDDEWLKSEFAEFGCHSARIVWDRERDRSKGFGYVEFNTPQEASKALAAKKGAEIDGRAVNLDYSVPRPQNDNKDRASKFGDKRSAPSDTVFIANLDFDVDESILSAEAEKFGTVVSLRIPTDRESGERKGFGYLTYSSIDEAQAAVDGLSGQMIGGRAVRTDFSTPRDNNNGGGRGGFGGGRGGRGGFGDRGGRGGGRGGRGGRGGFSDRGGGRGGRGGFGDRGGRGGSRGGFSSFQGQKKKFD